MNTAPVTSRYDFSTQILARPGADVRREEAEDATLHAAVETRWEPCSRTAAVTDAARYGGAVIYCASRGEYMQALTVVYQAVWRRLTPSAPGHAEPEEVDDSLVEEGVSRALWAVREKLKEFGWFEAD